MQFDSPHPWAILPYRVGKIACPNATGRAAGRCGPLVRGHHIGFRIGSPLDVELRPLNEVQFQCAEDEVEAHLKQHGLREGWRRGDVVIGLPQPFGLADYRLAEDPPLAMFLPNGENSIEWKLGFDVTIEDDELLLLFCDKPRAGLEIFTAVLTAANLDSMRERGGFAIAVRPLQTIQICRGDELARVIVLKQ